MDTALSCVDCNVTVMMFCPLLIAISSVAAYCIGRRSVESKISAPIASQETQTIGEQSLIEKHVVPTDVQKRLDFLEKSLKQTKIVATNLEEENEYMTEQMRLLSKSLNEKKQRIAQITKQYEALKREMSEIDINDRPTAFSINEPSSSSTEDGSSSSPKSSSEERNVASASISTAKPPTTETSLPATAAPVSAATTIAAAVPPSRAFAPPSLSETAILEQEHQDFLSNTKSYPLSPLQVVQLGLSAATETVGNQKPIRQFLPQLGISCVFPVLDCSDDGDKWEMANDFGFPSGLRGVWWVPKCPSHSPNLQIGITTEMHGKMTLKQYVELSKKRLMDTVTERGGSVIVWGQSESTRIGSNSAMEIVCSEVTRDGVQLDMWNRSALVEDKFISILCVSSYPGAIRHLYPDLNRYAYSFIFTSPSPKRIAFPLKLIQPEVTSALVILQHWWRGVYQRKQYQRNHHLICKLQRRVKCWSAYRRVRNIRSKWDLDELQQDIAAAAAILAGSF